MSCIINVIFFFSKSMIFFFLHHLTLVHTFSLLIMFCVGLKQPVLFPQANMMKIPSTHPHYCLRFHSISNNSFVPKSTAHIKVPLHTNSVCPLALKLFGHIHRTIKTLTPSRPEYKTGQSQKLPNDNCCTPQSHQYLQLQHSPHRDQAERVCLLSMK